MIQKRLREVSRAEYAAFIRAHSDLRDKPTEGAAISVMQHCDASGRLVAQAIYRHGTAPTYEIEKGESAA